jgi:cytochrome P450 / NADPH-cytochrome P450 reductase
MDQNHSPIPQPKVRPIVGNAPDIDGAAPLHSFMALARQYGPIYRLDLPGKTMLILSAHALVAEACDETRFEKKVGIGGKDREMTGDGLFTARNDEPNWAKAHRLLSPAFGAPAMKNYFEDMLDIASQMFEKWERLGPYEAIDVSDSMTRLTLDTIALSGFAYRFNSFYQREMHPFVGAMMRGLVEDTKRRALLPLQNRLRVRARRQFDADISYMREVTEDVIAKRRLLKPEEAPRDLLGLMLNGKDPQTGEGLDDENIRNQLITFLVAGHETTSGLLSFATYELLRSPEVLRRARDEVDEVLGADTPRFEQIAQLRYMRQLLQETLRLYPTAPAFALQALQNTTLGNRYPVTTDDECLVLLPALHRDPAVWADPERFDPDRFAEGRQIPPKAWMPFGNGKRACIGRAFAMQETLLVLAMMLQRFDIVATGPYDLEIQETLTWKPAGVIIYARVRPPATRPAGRPAAPAPAPISAPSRVEETPTHRTPLLVLYGSNSGASEAFARRIASDGSARGYSVQVATLDAHVGALSKEGATVIVTASYNGQPPDNARKFCAWIANAPAGALSGINYAIFGCGNRDWGETYQRVPILVDQQLSAAGARRLLPLGAADARADFFGDFEHWYAPLWDTLAPVLGVVDAGARATTRGPLYEVEVVPSTDLAKQNQLAFGKVLANRELVDMTSPFGRSKRHLEIALPDGASYTPGDYLAVLPENDPELVEGAARRFDLRPDAALILRSSRGVMAASLPTDRPVAVSELLGRHVELSAPATRRDVERLASSNVCPPHREHLAALAADQDRYRRESLEKRVSVLDLLENYPSCQLTFAEFLEMLPAMRVRQYSISSSPRRDASRCSLTIAVVDAPAWSGIGQFRGTCSSYLSQLEPGDKVAVAVRTPKNPFHLPRNNNTPIIMVCAGTGLAPFRGFIEDRAIRQAAGEPAGPALLFFGCDDPQVDFLYQEELQRWSDEGAVTMFPVFARLSDGEVTYVQHRLWQERSRVLSLVEQGAHVFVCGDGQHMAPAVRETLIRVLDDTKQDGARRLADLEQAGRYAADVFA